MIDEKWPWWTDLTSKKTVMDDFDDADKALVSVEEQEHQLGMYHDIANGFQWLREEERIGKWLGLAIATFLFGTLIISYIVTHGH
jgi:hypothetical protein